MSTNGRSYGWRATTACRRIIPTQSVFEPGKKDPSETAVELLDMKSEGADLVYSIKVLKGTPPAAGGQGSLFIDDMPVSSFDELEARDCRRHGCADF
jgi:hypothetical protein